MVTGYYGGWVVRWLRDSELRRNDDLVTWLLSDLVICWVVYVWLDDLVLEYLDVFVSPDFVIGNFGGLVIVSFGVLTIGTLGVYVI